MTVRMTVGGGKFSTYANAQLRQTLVEQSLIPKKGSLDASASSLSLGVRNQNVLAGSFNYRLEKWGKTNGFKCSGLKCRKTTWKTRLWRRTTPVDVTMSQSFPSPTKLTFRTEAKPRGDAKFLEELLLGGLFGFAGVVFADDIVGDIIESLADSIDPQTQSIGSIENYFSSKFSHTQAWPRMQVLLRLMAYDKSQTGFFSGGGTWEYVATQTTPTDSPKLLDVADFCTFVRPVLENTFGGNNKFEPLAAQSIENSGNTEILKTVSEGANIWTLSKEHYGNAHLYSHVLRTNGLDESAARTVAPGTIIKFPSTFEILDGSRFIAKGEHLWGISDEMLGDGSRFQDLDVTNRELADPNIVYPLDALVVK